MNQSNTGSWHRRGTTIILDDPFADEFEQQPVTLPSLASYDGMLESEVRSLVVGAGRTHPPLSKKMRDPSTTATMDIREDWNPDFLMRIQKAVNHPQGPGRERFREIFFERTGLMTGGLDEDAVRAAHKLLAPGGRLIFFLLVGKQPPDQALSAARSVIPPGLFRDIRTRFIPAIGPTIGVESAPHLLLMATKQ